ncbi:MAG: ATP-binding cassette domain-containing protein [Syntrophaceae bacterium]|nr:ATP-binding cassette domain-containing protein [Syntrophaceae bacterium]
MSKSICAELQGINVSFGAKTVLSDINLKIAANSITVLVGRSGSGKTTFLRIFNRLNELFHGAVTTGQVIVNIGGKVFDIHNHVLEVEFLRRKVGMVFQNPNVLPSSIYANIAMPLKVVSGVHGSEIENRIESVLRQVQLWDEVKDRLKQPAVSLSGGQQQRLCLARSLSLEPEILLLDEPTASLDFKATLKIEELLIGLRESYSIIAVSHSLTQTFRIANQIIVLKDGKVTSVIDPYEFRDARSYESIFEEIF